MALYYYRTQMGCFLGITSGLVLASIAIKIYIKLNTRWNNSYKCLAGKTAIVTGSNIGLGYAIAIDFAMRGARVILACRSKEKAEEARRKIIEATGNQQVIVILLDLDSFESVRQFAKDFNSTESRLDILVNNAGLVSDEDTMTEDGLPYIIKVNHLSPFLLTHLLIDKLKNAEDSRIVNMSSSLAKSSTLRADELGTVPKSQGVLKGSGSISYNNSKLCNVLFTMELAKKLEGTGVRVYAAHPGGTRTNLQGKSMLFYYGTLPIKSFFWTPEEGAQAAIYCAVSKEVEGHEGSMFGNCKKIGVFESAKYVTLARKVWELSEKFVKLSESEKLE